MKPTEFDVVTGAFGYSGKYIAERLHAAGRRVRTLTNSAPPDRANTAHIEVFPLCLDDPEKLVESLRGATTLYNTYWVRFDHRRFNHAKAVRNTKVLFEAAKRAGVRRIVHVSITNPSLDSPLAYFRGKAELERALMESGISYAILRPTVLFGKEDILINNIAWLLRRFPLFAVFGRGEYKLQPIFVGDLADIAVALGGRSENCIVDAIGPETFTYRALVDAIADAIGIHRPIVPMPAVIVWLAGWIIGKFKRDVTITRAEVAGLMQNLLFAEARPQGTTRFTTWVTEHASSLGNTYANELKRRNTKPPKPVRQKNRPFLGFIRIAVAALKRFTILQKILVAFMTWRFRIGPPGRPVFKALARRCFAQLSPATLATFLFVTVFKRRTIRTMPRTLFISVTNRCNLRCKQCYAAGWDRRSHLSECDAKRIIAQSKAHGADIFTILGGEPFVRRRLLFELLDAHPDCLFLVNSNGTLISEKVAQELGRFANVVVHVSLEGDRKLTDERRGTGVYEKALRAMDRLKANGVLFDSTIMVTRKNRDAITDPAFVRELIDHGAMAVWYTCYRPVGGDYDPSLIMSFGDRAAFFKKVVELRNALPILLVDNQFDYGCFGGCFATLGLNTHINSYGSVEPCPALHYSTDNVLSDTRSIAEIWQGSALLRRVRALHERSRVRCPITDAPEELLAALKATGAKDSTGGQDLGALRRLRPEVNPAQISPAPAVPDAYHGLKVRFLRRLFGPRSEIAD